MSRSLHRRRKRFSPEKPASGTCNGPETPPETPSEVSSETDGGEATLETTSETSLLELDALRAMLGLHERVPKEPGPDAALPGADET